jgi:hypothetical protein
MRLASHDVDETRSRHQAYSDGKARVTYPAGECDEMFPLGKPCFVATSRIGQWSVVSGWAATDARLILLPPKDS